MTNAVSNESSRRGLLAALFAYACWGFFPLYFHLLDAIPPIDILAWRIALSALLLVLGTVLMRKTTGMLVKLGQRRELLLISGATIAISINWYAFIYAVAIGEVLQASLGYFLVPVINSAFGVLVFGERPNRLKQLAVLVAALGIGLTFLVAGVVPWISLTLALTFGCYGMLRKLSTLDSSSGLLMETTLLLPLAVFWLWGYGVSLDSVGATARNWLMLSGFVTLLPLLSMVYGAQRIELGTLGFVQYLTPVMQFSIAVLVFAETLDLARLMAFGTTLLAVALWLAGSVQQRRSGSWHY